MRFCTLKIKVIRTAFDSAMRSFSSSAGFDIITASRQKHDGEDEMTIHTVVINDDTTGTIEDSSIEYKDPDKMVGQYITVQGCDENGMPELYYGQLTEVLI